MPDLSSDARFETPSRQRDVALCCASCSAQRGAKDKRRRAPPPAETRSAGAAAAHKAKTDSLGFFSAAAAAILQFGNKLAIAKRKEVAAASLRLVKVACAAAASCQKRNPFHFCKESISAAAVAPSGRCLFIQADALYLCALIKRKTSCSALGLLAPLAGLACGGGGAACSAGRPRTSYSAAGLARLSMVAAR